MVSNEKRCSECNKIITTIKESMCYTCRQYFANGGKRHHKPPYGEIRKTQSGKKICHYCGRSYSSLYNHTLTAHNISKERYESMFGLKEKKVIAKPYKPSRNTKPLFNRQRRPTKKEGY